MTTCGENGVTPLFFSSTRRRTRIAPCLCPQVGDVVCVFVGGGGGRWVGVSKYEGEVGGGGGRRGMGRGGGGNVIKKEEDIRREREIKKIWKKRRKRAIENNDWKERWMDDGTLTRKSIII